MASFLPVLDAFFQTRNNNKPRPNNARSRDGPVIGFFDNSINFCFSQLLPRLPPDFLCQDRRSENWLSVRVCVCQSFFPVAFPEKLVHYPRSIFFVLSPSSYFFNSLVSCTMVSWYFFEWLVIRWRLFFFFSRVSSPFPQDSIRLLNEELQPKKSPCLYW